MPIYRIKIDGVQKTSNLKSLLCAVYILIIISKVASVNSHKHNIYNDYGEKNLRAAGKGLLNRKDERTFR